MLIPILDFDTNLFLFINHLPHNLFFDFFFGILTLISSSGFVWFIIAAVVLFKTKRGKKEFLTVFLGALLSIVIGILLKNIIRRPRPQFVLPQAIVPFDFGHSFSFPSGHATIAFTMAYILSKLDEKRSWVYYLLAIFISFSRIYLGKHYPSDILGGVVLGLLIGIVSFQLSSRIIKE